MRRSRTLSARSVSSSPGNCSFTPTVWRLRSWLDTCGDLWWALDGQRMSQQFVDECHVIDLRVRARGNPPDTGQRSLGVLLKTPVHMPANGSSELLACLGELRAGNWAGVPVECQANDVEEIGAFLGRTAINRGL